MTDPIDSELKSHLRQWEMPPPAPDMHARLINEALRHPQQKPWRQIVTENARRALTEWQYAIGYKLAALAGCVALGLGIGIAAGETLDIAGVALMAGIGG
ncbi:hypothetical protein [Asticcacaulis sp.]|uniref:hypothetical protein n=1 Tax=Asticcacaulis sp. TaxID=1872648 RepID=UPI002BF6D7DF|nr:hypothetical protein [Asticcacaulis sp.]HTM81277.1 hypothetical protein [Asticcacaulis sp.]